MEAHPSHRSNRGMVKDRDIFEVRAHVCLLCNAASNVRHIDTECDNNGSKEKFTQMLQSCFNIQLFLTDSIYKTSGVCDICIKRTRDAVHFKKIVLEANKNLQTIAKLENETKVKLEVKVKDDVEIVIEKTDLDSDSAEEYSYESIDEKELNSTKRQNDIVDTKLRDSLVKPKSSTDSAVCDVCGMSCGTAANLTRHTTSYHTKKKFGCKICKKTYANRGAVTQHIRRCHKGIKIYGCVECSERFSDYTSRNKHLSAVHGYPTRSYVCPQCGREFFRSSRLSTHIRRDHYKIRPHSCTECDLCFFSKSELVEHMLKHNGVKNYGCHVCGKSYARKKTLTEHLKIHANLRAHRCELCGKDFVQKCTLKNHLKTHIRD